MLTHLTGTHMDPARPTVFDWRQAKVSHRDNLPHVRQQNVVYFVTFRLGDSLPAERIAELREERDAWLRLNPSPHTIQQEREYRRIWTARLEELLDAGHGSCVLRDEEPRALLEEIMRHHDGTAYWLGEYVIMPNHVHALLQISPERSLGSIVKAWKSTSARRIGSFLGERGSYWMDEYFDHCVRGDRYLEKVVQYIRRNPTHLPPGTYTVGRGTLCV